MPFASSYVEIMQRVKNGRELVRNHEHSHKQLTAVTQANMKSLEQIIFFYKFPDYDTWNCRRIWRHCWKCRNNYIHSPLMFISVSEWLAVYASQKHLCRWHWLTFKSRVQVCLCRRIYRWNFINCPFLFDFENKKSTLNINYNCRIWASTCTRNRRIYGYRHWKT